MKKWIGVLIIVQTVLFGMVMIQLEKIMNKIGQVGSVVLRKEGTIVSGEGLPVSNYVLFGILIILGIYLLIPEEKLK